MSESGAGTGILLSLTVFVSGGAVLVVEIVGTRVLTPFFGSTIYVWSSLITVALGFLAAGYVIGGRLADRCPRVVLLYGAVLLAGVFVVTLYQLRGLALVFGDRFGPRFGPLVTAAILFGLSFAVLGAVTPCAVRLAGTEPGRLGRRAGSIFALSTAGSLAGALASGFVLIQFLSTREILYGTGVLLVGVGLCGVIRHRRELTGRWQRALGVAVLAAPVALVGASVAMPRASRSGARLVYSRENAYGLVRVVDFPEDEVRYLTINNFGQSARYFAGQDRRSHLAIMALPMADLAPDSRILLLGLGGGQIVTNFDRPGFRWDIVELNPEVTRAAQQFMGFDPDPARHRLFAADARAFLRQHPGAFYDLILIDLYNGFSIPCHMLTEQALRVTRDRLADNGMAVFHIIGRGNGTDEFVNGFLATATAVFSHVYTATDDEDELNPLIVFAARGPVDLQRLNHRITEHNRLLAIDKGLLSPVSTASAPVFRDEDQRIELLWQRHTRYLRQHYMAAFIYPVDY